MESGSDWLAGAFHEPPVAGVRSLQCAVEERLFGTTSTPAPRIGRYVVGRALGRGGMGVVHEAYDPELSRTVAIKRLVGGDAADAAERARLLREAEAMAAVTHDNVVPVFDVGLDDAGEVYLVMALVDGVPLSRWLAEPRPWGEVVEAFVQAGRGLAAAHARGLIHRDFKPGNVMVGRDGRVFVLDFGLAHAANAPAQRSADRPTRPRSPRVAERLTETGVVMGTPAYMAPEQWSGQPVDTAADQYALCVALREALFGLRTQRDGTTVRRGRALPIDAGPARRLQRALARGLRRRPADRFPSMEALLAAVEAATADRRPTSRWSFIGLTFALALAAGGVRLSAEAPRPTTQPTAASDNGGDVVEIRAQMRVAERWIDEGALERARPVLQSAHLRAVEAGHAELALDTAIRRAHLELHAGADVEQIVRWQRRAEAYRAAVPPDPTRSAHLHGIAAQVAQLRGDPGAARRHHEAALRVAEAGLGPADQGTLQYRSILLHYLIQSGDPQAALDLASVQQDMLRDRPDDDPTALSLALDVGYARLAADDQTGAQQVGERVLARLDALPEQDRASRRETRLAVHVLLGAVYTNLAAYERARQQLAAAERLGPRDAVAMQVQAGAALVQCRTGDTRGGLDRLQTEIDGFIGQADPQHPGLVDLYAAVAECHELRGDDELAAHWLAETEALIDRIADCERDPCAHPALCEEQCDARRLAASPG